MWLSDWLLRKCFGVWYYKRSLWLGVDALIPTSMRRLLQHCPPSLNSALADGLSFCLEVLVKASFPFLHMLVAECVFLLSRHFLVHMISQGFEQINFLTGSTHNAVLKELMCLQIIQIWIRKNSMWLRWPGSLKKPGEPILHSFNM